MPENARGNLEVVMNRPQWSIAPYFIVDDVVAAANFYHDKMGFQYRRFWGEPPCSCMRISYAVLIRKSKPVLDKSDLRYILRSLSGPR